MGGYQRGCVSQLVYEYLESAVASGRNDVTPTVRSAGDWTSERKTGQKNRKRATENAPNLAGATPDAKVGAWTRMETACIFLGQAGNAVCASRGWDMVFQGGAPPVFFEGEGKKNWIIQSSWHAQSYPSLSRGFRGGSRPLIWRADKKRVQETQETV